MTPDEQLKAFLADINPEIVVADGLSHAFVGLTYSDGDEIAVYSTERIISNLMENDLMTFDDAEQYMHQNILDAYVGKRTPMFIDVIPTEFWTEDTDAI